MEETKEIKVKTKKKLSTAKLITIVGICIIAIPCLVFGGILLVAQIQKNTPREGNRFKNDLPIEITSADVDAIKADLASLNNIDSVVEVKCVQGQLKIYIDANDSLTESQVDDIAKGAYEKVNSKLPISVYFTKTETAKNYDLQINVYTSLEASASRQYKYLHKNAAEEKYQIDDMAHPKDPELVNELEGKNTTSEETIEEEEKPTE